PNIPLKQPDRSGPQGKTLLELAEERQAELFAEAEARQRELNAARGPGGKTPGSASTGGGAGGAGGASGRGESNVPGQGSDSDFLFTDEPVSPGAEAALLGFSLTALHLTLDILVHHQYRQSVDWGEIAGRAVVALPVMMLLVYVMRRWFVRA